MIQVRAGKLNFAPVARKLGGLVDRTVPLAMRQEILARALEPVKSLMRAKAHKRTGKSARSIDIEVLEHPDRKTALVAVGVGHEGFPLVYQEFGTHDKAARPTIRPSWESEAARVQRAVAADTAAALGKGL
jgi:hypothetical protein